MGRMPVTIDVGNIKALWPTVLSLLSQTSKEHGRSTHRHSDYCCPIALTFQLRRHLSKLYDCIISHDSNSLPLDTTSDYTRESLFWITLPRGHI